MKKIIKKFMVLTTMLSTFIYANAYDFEVDGIYYNIISVSNETCTVTKSPNLYSGIVEIPSEVQYAGRTFTVKEIEAYAFEDNLDITQVHLGENIVKIGSCAFNNCINIKTVILDCINCASAGTFELPAFMGCTNITKVQFGEKVTNVPNYFMKECGSLYDLQLSKRIKSIGAYAFSDCSGIVNFVMSDSIVTINQGAFSKCVSLKNISFSLSLKTIGVSAFEDCSSLADIVIPNNITEIKSQAFSGCRKIKKVDFSECNLLTIGMSAFYNCTNLTEVKLSPMTTTIGNSAFSSCSNIHKLSIPKSVVSIGREAFSNCTNLVYVKFMNSCASIGAMAFLGDSLLTEIDLGDSIVSIEREAFIGCNLETITIPNSVSSLYPNTFDDNLKELIIADGNSPIMFDMDSKQGDHATYYSYTGSTKLTPHYVTYYSGVIAPNIEKLYLGRNINYGPNAFKNNSQVQISSPVPSTVKTLTLGPGFTHITYGFDITTSASYFQNSTSARNGVYSYAKCTKTKKSIIPPFLEEIRIFNPIPPKTYTDVSVADKYLFLFTNDQYKQIKLYIPTNSADLYKTAEVWENFLFIQETNECDIIATELIIDKEYVELGVSDTFQIVYTLSPSNVFNTNVLFQSLNPEIAQVSEDGLVSAKAVGETKILVSTIDGSDLTVELNVCVIDSNETGIDDVLKDIDNDEIYIVYNIQGIYILKTDDIEKIANLPSGIYIVNGKKIIIK